MSPQRTAWHFYFTIVLRNRRPLWIDVRDEVPLSEERPRVDYLFLRKVQNPAPGDTGQTLRLGTTKFAREQQASSGQSWWV